MLQSIARVMNYGALTLVFLLAAVAAYGGGAVMGYLLGVAVGLVPRSLTPGPEHDSTAITFVLVGAGALIGAGYGLILMWRAWIAHLQQSNDENLRNLGNYFDELRHAVRYKP